MTAMLPFSILDQSPISEGSTGAQALRNSVDLARLGEELGYARYWVAEHHGTPALACASPEALLGPVAVATSRIRIGSGGVMLPHYSPLKVAETFSMLAVFAPGRLDLGIGRAAGTDPVTTFALQRDRRQAGPDDFPAQLFELLGYLDDTLPHDHPFARLAALPGRPELPAPWLLGSSAQSAIWAAELGLPYAFADFIAPHGGGIAADYRRRFEPSRHAEKPYVVAALWVVCADSDEEAKRIAASARMMFTLFFRGQLIPIPPIGKALAFLEQQPKDDDPFRQRRRAIVGAPSTVRAGILEAVAEYEADEVMIVTITYAHEARRHSYELLAREFQLNRPA
ncbi:MAG TPA: LLM class flavin-dependent oxidoreductase [Thermoanaerobaculia bacterium]|jgi:luciferase family oxidoreductase group 1|nr:LLM class flavin-dependent oxidoreductase [Thermoanaerobaculia bacterium]